VIRAVFFDWFNTLARYEPRREELQSQALQEFGIQVPPQEIIPALAVADRDFYRENASFPIRQRKPEEQAQIYTRYQQIILSEIKVNLSGEPDLLLKITEKVHELGREMKFVLFDDVLPTLKTLQGRDLTLGLITNLDREMQPLSRELGLEAYLSFVVTSVEAGADKPNPPIFLAALNKANVSATEAIHVGDQYQSDVAGAVGVGINPILLDRDGLFTEVSDCPRIGSLTEITNHL